MLYVFNCLITEFLFFYLILSYFISFFIERHIKFLYFFLIQVCLLLLISYFFCDIGFIFNIVFWFSCNNFIWFFKFFCILSFFFFVNIYYFMIYYLSKNNFLLYDYYYTGFFEYSFICLIFIFSGFFFLMSNDFLNIYLFLEIQSICLYILAAFNLESTKAAEASLKYFIFGIIFSGLFLFGFILILASSDISNLYYLSDFIIILLNSFYFFEMQDYFKYEIIYCLNFISIGFLFMVISIIAKLGLFPFQNWILDVYEGVSVITLFFFSIFPKIFLIIFLVRFIFFFKYLFFFGFYNVYWFYIMSFIAMGSIIFGSIGNLSQWKIKRFLVFSSIANLGYIFLFFIEFYYSYNDILIGISLNLVIYVFSIIYFFILFFSSNMNRYNFFMVDINEIFLLRNSNSIIGLLFIFLMLSFAGVPPFLGFYGKLYLLIYLWNNNFFILFIFLLIFSLVSSFYYIRFARSFYNLQDIYLIYRNLNIFNLYCFYFFLFFIFLFIFFFINYFALFCEFIIFNL